MSPLTSRRGAVGVVSVAVGVALLVGATAIVSSRHETRTAVSSGPRLVTATVTQETLVEAETVTGSLNYGTPWQVDSKVPGTITWLAAPGATVSQGGVLAKVDDKPIILMSGALPMYRALNVGVKGNDVRQFEENLHALGYTGFTVDSSYTRYTADAVKRWQKDVGLDSTGAVDLGRVVFTSGPLRVSSQAVSVGATSPAQILGVTGRSQMVTADVPVENATWAVPGTKVLVVGPDGKTTPGSVLTVGAPVPGPQVSSGADSSTSGVPPTITVTVALSDARALGASGQAPVQVRHTTRERKGVLTVPVAALLALAEGGYGLELVDHGRSQLVAVKTGLFSEGRVEVTGAGLRPGLVVRVAS